jgi:anaphase-promoting complex subunit 1
MSSVAIHNKLAKGHEPTSVALLLGLAATKRGTMDADTARVLSIHVPALLPSTSAEVEVPIVVQTAAMVGLGLVYQGSCHRRMVEVMVMELGRSAPLMLSGQMDRESYALTAGLALGLVLLGKVGGRAGKPFPSLTVSAPRAGRPLPLRT